MGHIKHEFAVIGLGRFGTAVALTLAKNGHHVLGIDRDIKIVQRLAAQLTHVVSLDSTDEEALRQVDIGEFGTVVVAIGTDFENALLTVATLKSLGVPQVVCKTLSQRQSNILYKIGADRVIMPEYEAGRRLALDLTIPNMIEHFDIDPVYGIAEVMVPRSLCNQSLKQLNVNGRFGINILLIKRGDAVTISPSADYILLEKDLLVIFASNIQVEAFSKL
ncbi:MAG: potassium channel family protein [Candidatus Promineifilaceae bacterium]